MEYETKPQWESGTPINIGNVLGEIVKVNEECPGVCYAAVQGKPGSYFTQEYYIVAADTPVIPQQAKKYGRALPGHPELLLYSMDEARGGYKIIEYEIAKYRTEHGLPLPNGDTLHGIEIFNMEYHPEYFGPYPAPSETPAGPVLRQRAVDNGVCWLDTEQGGPLLAVCYPIWRTELSDYAIGLSQQTARDRELGIDHTLGYLFFSAKDSCVPIYELLSLRDEWKADGRIDAAALMNAIWTYHPGYAACFNLQEQAGLHDTLGLLLRTLGGEAELSGSPEHMIAFSPEAGTDFCTFAREL